ncbi:hypothetical protein BKA70DRAFT_1521730 [Coprinopsis sp. MPI-PUGE-AT-0042]|nr:hypothetical protein BKA70DRAFT_1521730 [Coprinopsis sp. MPI-PUGE-AT-0042]
MWASISGLYQNSFTTPSLSSNSAGPIEIVSSMKLIFSLCVVLLSIHATFGLYISLVEERPHSRGWHFGLLLHNGPRIKGRPIAWVDQALIQNRTPGSGQRLMKYNPAPQEVRQSQLVVTVGPLRLQGAANDDALEAKLTSLFQTIPASEITSNGNFKNCLDFALEAVKRVKDQGHMTTKQWDKFWDYHRRIGAEVRAKTTPNILRICGKGQSGGACKPSPSVKKGPPAKGGKVKRSIRY